MATIRVLLVGRCDRGISTPGHAGPPLDGEPAGDRMTARNDKVSRRATAATLPHWQGNPTETDIHRPKLSRNI
jgi:hypothetical protein